MRKSATTSAQLSSKVVTITDNSQSLQPNPFSVKVMPLPRSLEDDTSAILTEPVTFFLLLFKRAARIYFFKFPDNVNRQASYVP